MAYWVLSQGVLKPSLNESSLPKETETRFEQRYHDSIDLIERVRNKEFRTDYEFQTFDFNPFEMINLIKGEIMSIHLFSLGIPFSRWSRREEQSLVNIGEKEIDSVTDNYSELFHKLFRVDVIPTIHLPLGTLIGRVTEHLAIEFRHVFDYLIFRVPMLRTIDILYLSGSIAHNIDYFVTTEQRLLSIKDRLIEVLSDSGWKMKIISPDDSILSP